MEMIEPKESLIDMRFALNGWADYADDYSMIVELMPQYLEISALISALAAINKQLPRDAKEIFDGRVSRLKNLVKRGYIKLENISDPRIYSVAKKYLGEVKESDQAVVSTNRWSPEALRCKAVSIGLWLYAGKLSFRSGLEITRHFETLNESDFPMSDDDAAEGRLSKDSLKKMQAINTTWIALVSDPNLPAKTIADVATEDAFSETGYTEFIIRSSLYPVIWAVVKENFPSESDRDGTVPALRKAISILLHSISRYLPEHAKRNPRVKLDGLVGNDFKYIIKDEGGFQDWFVEFFSVELSRRCRLIQSLKRNNFVWRFEEDPKKYVSYLPLLDSFRFWSVDDSRGSVFAAKILQDDQLPIEDRNLIAKNLVFAMQSLASSSQCKTDNDGQFEILENCVKDGFISLLLVAMRPLGKKIFWRTKGYMPNDPQEVWQVIVSEFLDAILKYDPKKNDSFFGYIKATWELKARTGLRSKKIERTTDYSEQSEDFRGLDDVFKNADNSLMKESLERALSGLTPKVRSAIEKRFIENEKLNEAERKAAYRGLTQLAAEHPELRDLI